MGDLIGMGLLLVGVLEELLRHALGVDARGHEIVTSVPQHAYDLRRERLIEQPDHGAAVSPVAGGHGPILDVLPRALSKLLDVGEKWFLGHALPLISWLPPRHRSRRARRRFR